MKHCTTDKCPQILDSSCVFYEGASLIFSGINTNDSVETVIQKLNLKLESIPGINLDNYYTKNEADNLFLNYYIKTETYSQTQIDNIVSDLELEIDNKVNSSDVYLKTQTYSQTEINNFLSGKQNTIDYAPENVANKSDSYTASSSTTYASTKALVDGLATKLDKGGYTGNAQDLKNEIDTKQKLLSSFDESILIEPDGNIEGNVSLFTEYFNQQVCELNFIPIQIIGVYQDGIKLLPEEFNITLPKTITITTYSTEKIEIQYTHLKNN